MPRKASEKNYLNWTRPVTIFFVSDEPHTALQVRILKKKEEKKKKDSKGSSTLNIS